MLRGSEIWWVEQYDVIVSQTLLNNNWNLAHMIGLTRGKFTYMHQKNQPNVGKQTNLPYMDGIGLISNHFHPFPLGRSQVHLLLPSLGPSSALGLFHSKQRTLGDWVALVWLHTEITGKAYVRENPPPKLPYKVQYLHFRVAENLGDH